MSNMLSLIGALLLAGAAGAAEPAVPWLHDLAEARAAAGAAGKPIFVVFRCEH